MSAARKPRLDGQRVLVVGASSGIGLAAARATAAEGAHVAFAARRLERCEEAAREAGGGAFALACDVRDEAQCEAAVASAVETMGGLDAFVYAPGISPFAPLRALRFEDWRGVMESNLIGATAVCRASIEALEASRGRGVFLGSISIDDRPPRYGAAPYVVSKVALEALALAWQGEHPHVRFTTLQIGDTQSEFGVGVDPTHLEEIIKRWEAEGYLYGRMMEAESVAEQVVNVLASREHVARLRIEPVRAEESTGTGRES